MAMKDLNRYGALMARIHGTFQGRKIQYRQAKAEIKKVIKKSEHYLDEAVNAVYDRDRIRSLASLARFYAMGLRQIGKIPGVTPDDVRKISYIYGQVIDAGLDKSFSDVWFASTASPKRNQAYLEIRANDERMDMFLEDYESALEKKLFRTPQTFRLLFRHNRIYSPAANSALVADHRKMCLFVRF